MNAVNSEAESISTNMKNGMITYNGDKFWYKDNMLHRKNGPAVELKNGNKVWYQDGQRHRMNGPAIELYENFWYIYGEQYSEKEYKIKIKQTYFEKDLFRI